jgi:hypothetical protein
MAKHIEVISRSYVLFLDDQLNAIHDAVKCVVDPNKDQISEQFQINKKMSINF